MILGDDGRRAGGVRLGLKSLQHGARQLLLDVRHVAGGGRCRDATFRHESRVRVVAAGDGRRIALHSIRGIDSLDAAGVRAVGAGIRERADLAGDVRDRRAVDPAGGAQPLHVQLSRLLHRHRTDVPALRLHHRPLRLAAGLLHDGNHRHLVVHHVVLPRLQHAVGPSAHLPSGARVHRAERLGGDQGTSGHEGPVAVHLHESPRLGHRHHHVRADLGALHVHHAGPGVHEEHPELRHSKQWRDERPAVPLLVPVVRRVLLRRRRAGEAQDSQPDERAEVDDGIVADHSRAAGGARRVLGDGTRQRSHHLEHCGDDDHRQLCRSDGEHRGPRAEPRWARAGLRSNHPHVRVVPVADGQRNHLNGPEEFNSMAALLPAVVHRRHRDLHHVPDLRHRRRPAMELPVAAAKRRRATAAGQKRQLKTRP